MDFFVNDLSLDRQFADHLDFRQALEEVMRCHKCAASYKRTLKVPRGIASRLVSPTLTFRQAVQASGDRNFVIFTMGWIDKHGPFVEDDLLRSPGEYLELNDGTVVSEEAIGEAATRHFQSSPAGLVSFAPSAFQYTPIEVHWHRDDGSTTACDLSNYWSVQELDQYLEGQRQAPTTWKEFIEQLPGRFPNLTFLPNLEHHLAGQPFFPYVVERSFILLDVLNRLKTCFDAEGRRTAEGEALVDNYFRRAKAVFSDSSDSEKNDANFRSAMSFKDLEGRELICFWHGKIKTPQYRIHFSYPIENDAPLYIAYIGEKLTKK